MRSLFREFGIFIGCLFETVLIVITVFALMIFTPMALGVLAAIAYKTFQHFVGVL